MISSGSFPSSGTYERSRRSVLGLQLVRRLTRSTAASHCSSTPLPLTSYNSNVPNATTILRIRKTSRNSNDAFDTFGRLLCVRLTHLLPSNGLWHVALRLLESSCCAAFSDVCVKHLQSASTDAAATATVDASTLATPSVERMTAPYVELRLCDSYTSGGVLEQSGGAMWADLDRFGQIPAYRILTGHDIWNIFDTSTGPRGSLELSESFCGSMESQADLGLK
ncbi:hypothetical protein C8R44DRAFT_862131 [Mycena epipterygia]|nr:hypothetical protein C8R44DRAFT_862131 [Mycena epipterygia]